ncbi:hypothetical protein LSTR_LSTR016469 [Laodelphax striatellus]|uniref:Uncharacterized protein n=1 Tax=Laodelphax striatellus TaxID=195883 RepID=A0A482XN81_LAOST|nr:hypothetical protein LSTR_LSTR016469 [Laodelphax striatellus]
MAFLVPALAYIAPSCPVVVSTVGGWIGFSAIGPVAGTIAAGIQASAGAVAAGSAFAIVQSTAMTTAAVAGSTLAAAGGGILTAVGAAAVAVKKLRKKKKKVNEGGVAENDEEEEEEEEESEEVEAEEEEDGAKVPTVAETAFWDNLAPKQVLIPMEPEFDLPMVNGETSLAVKL